MGTFGLHVAAALLATTGFSSLAARAEGFRVGVDPYMPITVPLAVRSPYLGAFLSGGNDKNLAGVGATFWTGSPLGWTGLARIDGEVFVWMGNKSSQWSSMYNASFVHTASSSTFTFIPPLSRIASAAPRVELEASFISPVTPTDVLHQSLPFSYLRLSVRSLDSKPHEVQLYTDVNGLWLADEEDERIKWTAAGDQDKGWKGSSFQLENQRLFQESKDRILYGDMYYVAQTGPGSSVDTTLSTGHDADSTRRLFARAGSLGAGAVNDTFRQTRTRNASGHIIDEPTFAIAHDFGFVSTATPEADRSVLLSIGHVRTPIVSYMTRNLTSRKEVGIPLQPLWRSRFADVSDLITFCLSDFDTSLRMSQDWDRKLEKDARKAHGAEYANVVAVSTRQIFMALEAVWDETVLPHPSPDLLIPSSLADGAGTQVMLMLKEISSNGNCQTVDVIAPALPFWLYANPQMLSMLLEPLLRYVDTGLYKPVPPPHDIGDHYPLATGRNDFVYPSLPLEESGNMLTMLYASALVQGQRGEAQIRRYWTIIEKWAEWLAENTLYPGEQRSTDDFFMFEANQTSLVVKGIAGLGSMAEMAGLLGDQRKRKHYRDLASGFVEDFLALGMAEDGSHLLGAYANQSSWVTQYNLYFDKLLGLDLFPESIYRLQDAFYLSKAQPYGLALDSRMPDRSKTDWLLWAAGTSSRGSNARNMFVDAVAKYFRQSGNNVFGDLITPEDGWSVGFLTRPVVGGHFSLLALEVMRLRRRPLVEVIAGLKHRLSSRQSVLSLLAILAMVVVVASCVCLRRSRRSKSRKGPVYVPVGDEAEPPTALADQRVERCLSDSPLDIDTGSFELISNPSKTHLLTNDDEEAGPPFRD